MDAGEIKRLRTNAGLSQAAVADLIGVTQGLISHWERGRSAPSRRQLEALERALKEPVDEAVETTGTSGEDYGEWLRDARMRAALSRSELAARAAVSSVQIFNIETGRTANPRDTTRAQLEAALSQHPPGDLVEAVERNAEIAGVGRMSDFDPHTDDEFPQEPGVYVLYDISDRPVYIGKSDDIRRRLRDHVDKFYYRRPIVEKASYVRVDDPTLRGQLEETLIKFLKSNAVINQRLVDR